MWEPRYHQRAPEGDWDTLAFIAGRGAGKTDGAADYVVKHVHGPPCLSGPQPHRLSITGPTLGDAVDACVTGPSGIRAHDLSARLVQTVGGTFVRWPNGSEARLFGAYGPEDVERFRAGGNRCLAWLEEFAAWRMIDEVLAQIEMGTRVGPHPRKIVSSTPKPKQALKDVLADPGTVRTYTEDGRIPTMNDNPDLPQHVRDRLTRMYAGTRRGRQELGGELLDDIPGAYWSSEAIDANRLRVAPPDLIRVTIAIDPAVTVSEESDETGIIAAGKAIVPAHTIRRPEVPNMDIVHPDAPHLHYFVLADESDRYSPTEWANAAVALYDRLAGDRVVGETNNGGDMVEATLRRVRRSLPFRKITASRGKEIRAQPISALYEQDLVHHVGELVALEDQQTAYTGPKSIPHDDRMDADVYAITDLMTSGVAFVAGKHQHGSATAASRRTGRMNGYVDPRGN